MTDQIKISEVSAILKQELEGVNSEIKLEEVCADCTSVLSKCS